VAKIEVGRTWDPGMPLFGPFLGSRRAPNRCPYKGPGGSRGKAGRLWGNFEEVGLQNRVEVLVSPARVDRRADNEVLQDGEFAYSK